MRLPRIYTGSWRTLIDDRNFVRVAISRGTPRFGQPGSSGFKRFTKLAPGQWFKTIDDPVQWAKRYRDEILAPLDPAITASQLAALSADNKPVVLLCWEVAGGRDWCHRALVSVWFKERLDIDVSEFGDASCQCGRDHPLLPQCLR